MRYAMTRDDYEELCILGQEAQDAPDKVKADIIAKEYPKSTEEAVLELRKRGLNVDRAKLDYLIRKQAISEPRAGTGRNRLWTKRDIDKAARYLDEQQDYVPTAVACMVDNIDPGQDERAFQQVCAENADVHPSRDYFVREVFPGAAGVGLYATVRYRRMTRQEEAEWRQRIAAAKAALGETAR